MIDLETASQFYNYIDKGGLIFIILIFFSIISITIIFLKIIQFYSLNQKSVDQIEEEIVSSENLDDFIRKKKISNMYCDIIYSAAVILKKNKMEKSQKVAEIAVIANKEIKKNEKFLPSLEIISQTSPLIGLLGTVIGMISSFNQLEIGGSAIDPAVLAGGIWTALLTTAAGLIVAIPAVISHYFFEKKIEKFQENINQLLITLENSHKNYS